MTSRRLLLVTPLCLVAARAHAQVELTGKLEQGAFITGRAPPGTRLTLDGRWVRVSREGSFAFGFGRDATSPATLAERSPTGVATTRALRVARRFWVEQRIDNLPAPMVTPPSEALERIGRERELLLAARTSHDTDRAFFDEGFEWPTQGRISGVFGSRRILNGETRQPHLGVDVAVPVGTPVKAGCGGIVRLAGPDFYYTGNVLVLDHGHGVTSTYMHLSRMDVRGGDTVRKGQVIGAVGATGRVTGPHLHWEIGWLGIPLDPQSAVGPMPG